MKLYILSINEFNNEKSREHYVDLIDAERRERIEKIKSENDKLRSLAAGVLINHMREDAQISSPISYGEHGKPYVTDNSLYFNLSHSGDYVAIAYGDNEVGIDIQKKRKITEALAARILTPSELGNVNTTDQDLMGLTWSIKEAYIKMIGVGLSFDMRNCEIKDDRVLCLTGSYPDAYFKSFTIMGGDIPYYLTVCSASHGLPDSYELLTLA